MGAGLLYENKAEEKLHQNTIQSIAKEVKIPVYKVTPIYEAVLKRFKDHAKVKDFFPVLVKKEVKEILFEKIKPKCTSKDKPK